MTGYFLCKHCGSDLTKICPMPFTLEGIGRLSGKLPIICETCGGSMNIKELQHRTTSCTYVKGINC